MTRLHHLLARNLGCSRAAARRLIAAGEVRDPDGTPLADDAARARTVSVAGRLVSLVDSHHLMLNKPVGYVTALHDRRHPTAYSLLRGAPLAAELRPAGRLDLDTTGLLIWTTDGAWLHALTHPKRRVPRTYQAALARPFRAADVGLTLDDGHRPEILALEALPPDSAHPSLARPPETAAWATITIVGGAYHEVRRIFAALGSHVLALCRVGFGRLSLPRDLSIGGHRAIHPDEV